MELQRQYERAVEQWPSVHERLLNAPNVDALEAVEGKGRLVHLEVAWRDLVAQELKLADLDRPQVVDLDRLAQTERKWIERTEQIARQRVAGVQEFVPATVAEAAKQLDRLLKQAPPEDADRTILADLLRSIDAVAPDAPEAQWSQQREPYAGAADDSRDDAAFSR